MGSLHHPAASLECRIFLLFMSLFASLFDVRLIVPFDDCVRGWCAFIACIRAQIVLSGPARDFHHYLVQGGFEQFDIMRVCAARDDGQRDPNSVHQQASLAPIFSPDP